MEMTGIKRAGLCLWLVFLSLPFFGLWAKEEEMEKKGRPLHYLSTDKQYYHPGERVYMRDVVLDGMTNYPLAEFMGEARRFQWKITGPRQEEVASGEMRYESSVGGMSWSIPLGAPGGVYRLRVYDGEGKGAPAERTFEVRQYRVPLLRSQIAFARRGYLPGEEVVAVLSCVRADGGALEAPRVSASVLVDGKLVFRQEGLPWENGGSRVAFALPEEMAEGDGALNFTIEDGGILETASKSIPILLSREEVHFYPEGGDLVLGVPNRVYVEALQRNGKGADIRGSLKDEQGQEVCPYQSVFEGRGILEFTPEAGRRYHLEVPAPRGGEARRIPLPEAVAGSALRAKAEAYPFGEKLVVEVKSSPGATRRPGSLVLRKREKEICRLPLGQEPDGLWELTAGEEEGVLVATLYATDDTPLAERLLFRLPKEQVNLEVLGLEEARVPGQKVTLKVRSTDGGGKPVSAQVGLCVTDASVEAMVDRRDAAPRLPVMVFLENEVLSLTDAEEYLRLDTPAARQRLDLLLGTQGWRRFVFQRQEEIRNAYPDALMRILAPTVELVRAVPYRRFAFFKNMRVEDAPMELMAVEDDGMAMVAMAGAVNRKPPAAAPAPVMDAKGEMDQAKIALLPAPPVPGEDGKDGKWVREYAHKAREGRRPGDRADFTETVYWAANVTTDPRTGLAEFSFALPDTIGAFRVTGDAFCGNGSLGAFTGELRCVQPFYGEVKLPLFLSTGDQALLPITLVNATQEELAGVNLSVEVGDTLRLLEKAPSGMSPLAPGERRGLLLPVEALKAGEAKVVLRAMAGGHQDVVTRTLQVRSPLFPLEIAGGARLSAGQPLKLRFLVPDNVENGSQRVTAQVYTSPAATMEAALNALLRQPHGCFEQTSSTNYPLVMAQQYFMSHAGCDPQTIARAQSLLDEGYQKLVSFQCEKKGYEWFGKDPGHEALSAYGLMEFADMAKVMPVDEAMVADTRRWLLERRDGQGGFQRNEKALDSFGRAPKETTDAYILWALLESGENPQQLEKEIQQVAEMAKKANDDYLKGLAANILWLAKRPGEAREFALTLARHQQEDGTLKEAGSTITCSRGISQTLECASLAALAWIRCGEEFIAPVEKTMAMLAESCRNGKFGSTQSTVLVLKAINAYDAAFARPKGAGSVQLWLDGQPMGEAVAFGKESQGILSLPDCGLGLTPGEHLLEIRLQGEGELNSSLLVEAMTPLAQSTSPLAFSTSLDRQEAVEGEPLSLLVTLGNPTQEEVSMPVAVVPVPGGLEPRQDQLKELVDAGRIAAFEVQGQEVVLYWRGLRPGEEVQVPLSVTAAIPGEYTGAASRAYAYYDDLRKGYQPGVKVKVAPRKR